MLATSVLCVAAARAESAATPAIDTAWTRYYTGQAVTARRGLEEFLATADGQDLAARRSALEALLDICVYSLADDCLVKYAGEYAETARKTPTENPVQHLELWRRVGYYAFSAQLARGSPDQVAAILQSPNWDNEHAYDVELYIRRQVLAANVLLRLDKPVEANRRIDKVLSLIAAVKNPRDGAPTIAWALSQMMEDLWILGDNERAHGLLQATGPWIEKALPVRSVDAALFQLRAAELMQEVGRGDEALRLFRAAVATIDAIELEPETRDHLLILALTELAGACARSMDLDCARAALARHPYSKLYAEPGRAPAGLNEVRYLTVRAITAGVGQTTDDAALSALRVPLAFEAGEAERETAGVLREVGIALAEPPGLQHKARLLQAGRLIRDLANRKRPAPFGAWYRSGAFDQSMIVLAATQADQGTDADAAFALLQLMNRAASTFDADALSALALANGEAQRRALHQALRLKARRDALERDALRRVAEQMATGQTTGQRIQQDYILRNRFRNFSQRIEAASQGLAPDGIVTSGTNLVALKQLQATLAPDEAALTLAPTVGGLVYMCVRRDDVLRRVSPVDLGANRADFRLMQLALTAGHAPSEVQDAQFPVASAVRLYDVLIRPFEPCLKPGDHIIWLPNLATVGFPIQALLEHAPPKLEKGWDLSAAAWLARTHAVTYAGAASTIVAARTARSPPPAYFDFLGVGDPRLDGLTATGEDRAALATRGLRAGVGLAALAPLPETREELERSARGFRTAKVLIGEAATETGFRNQLTGAYRYLSFATHGLMREDLQGLADPALVLTPVSGADPANDGLLTAAEIADMNLSARFVALSACNTANVDVARMAQDLPALASAFAVAGVPATLGTLWPVDSETGKQVVAATFERLRDGMGPARALAEAQRAFLANPPGRAWLHPRFWAPFVLMGDGGVARDAATPPGALTLTSVEMLEGDGETRVMRLPQGQVLTRYSGRKDPSGAYPNLTNLSTPVGSGWRRSDTSSEYGEFLAKVGDRVIVGGTIRSGPEKLQPSLEALDLAAGAPAGAWRGKAIPEAAAVLMGGRALDADRAVFAVKTIRPIVAGKLGDAKLYAFETGRDLAPRLLFETLAPPRGSIRSATLTPLGEDLLVAYGVGEAFEYPRRPAIADDFDLPTCSFGPLTRLELRDRRSGALKESKDLYGYLIRTALAAAHGRVLLGGSHTAECGDESRATVIAVDAQLAVSTLYRDATLGDSDVRTMSTIPDGRTFVAAAKDNKVDFPGLLFGVGETSPDADELDAMADALLYSGMLVVVDPHGNASAPVYLNAGASLYVTSSDASTPGDILLGGGIDDTPAIFHLSAAAGRARR